MPSKNQSDECREALEKLVDRKVTDIDFKSYNDDCWRIYISTDHGKMVMTFCKGWNCPVVEHRDEAVELDYD